MNRKQILAIGFAILATVSAIGCGSGDSGGGATAGGATAGGTTTGGSTGTSSG